MISKLRGRVSSAHVIALAALFVALGGTAFAAATIGTNDIKNQAVTKPKIAKKAVTTGRIADQAVTERTLRDQAVTNPKLADSSVDSAKIADSSVTASELGGTTQVVSANTSVNANGNGTVSVQCPAGTQVLSGGGERAASWSSGSSRSSPATAGSGSPATPILPTLTTYSRPPSASTHRRGEASRVRRNALALSGALLMAMIGLTAAGCGGGQAGTSTPEPASMGQAPTTTSAEATGSERPNHSPSHMRKSGTVTPGTSPHEGSQGGGQGSSSAAAYPRIRGRPRLDHDHTGLPERIEEPTGSPGRPWPRR